MDHAGHTRQCNTPPGSKKRKLSDNESPSAKQFRTGVSPTVSKTSVVDGEHEVSSSSEAEVVLSKPVRKLNTIDKFFRPKPSAQDQEEISSTNEVIEIDLTEDSAGRENVINSEQDNISKEISSPEANTPKVDRKICDNDSQKKETDNSFEDDKAENDTIEDISLNEDKENLSDVDADSSFIANTSVCEDALKTPAKGSALESVLKVHIDFYYCIVD